MKILFFSTKIPPSYGGGYLRIARTASRLKEKGFLYKIMTYTNPKLFNGFENLRKEDILFLPGYIISQFYLCYLLLRTRKEFDVLYITSGNWFTTIAAIVCKKIINKKVVIGITLSKSDSPAHTKKSKLFTPYYIYKNLQFFIADKIYVLSPLLGDECINSGIDARKIKIINNPINTILYRCVSITEKNEIREKLSINKQSRVFLFVGGVNRRKGFDLFQYIFEQYFQVSNNDNISFVVCGSIDYEESLGLLTELQNIFVKHNAKLYIMGIVKETHLFYKMADYFIFPTTNEGMPNVILEAMACGCNILCNNLTGITDYILEDYNLVRENNVSEYVEKILFFENNNKKRKEIQERNLYKINKNYSVSVVDDLFIKELI